MPHPEPLPHPLHLGPFRFREAQELGVSRRRLRRNDVIRPHRDVYAAGPAGDDIRDRCDRALPLLGANRWFSHLTAARLWEAPLPFEHAASESLHVLSLPGAGPIRRPGIVGWESADADVDRRLLGIVPIVAPAAVWCQMAVPGATGIDAGTGARRNLSRDWLVAVGDFLLTGPRHRRSPLCTREELAEALRRHRGKRGAKAATWAIERLRAPVHSPRESLLRLALVRRGLPEPEVQVPVQTSGGLRHADLGYPDARLLIEYQGDHHRTDRRQWLEDLARVQLFEDAGYRVIAAGANEFDDDCAGLALRIRRALASRTFVPDRPA